MVQKWRRDGLCSGEKKEKAVACAGGRVCKSVGSFASGFFTEDVWTTGTLAHSKTVPLIIFEIEFPCKVEKVKVRRHIFITEGPKGSLAALSPDTIERQVQPLQRNVIRKWILIRADLPGLPYLRTKAGQAVCFGVAGQLLSFLGDRWRSCLK